MSATTPVRSRLILATIALALPIAVPAQPAPAVPGCLAGTTESFGATGSLQTYELPGYATSILIAAEGASGGNTTSFTGGRGHRLFAGFPGVSGGTSLNVLVGVAGTADTSNSGGGGGSFVYTDGAEELLIAAGGGGGAGATDDGHPASGGPDGDDADPPFGGAGGTGGSGGGASDNSGDGNAAGGGGWLGAGEDGPGASSGLGGDRISSPGTAAGGTGVTGHGGYGGGGGGAGPGGGGGGGYSGGGGGYGKGADGGGGGGSFLAPGAQLIESFTRSDVGNGEISICVNAGSRTIPTLSTLGLILAALTLLTAGFVVLRRKHA